jgi:hypothetical protein
MEDENKKDQPNVQAEENSIAIGGIHIGGNITGSQITIGNNNAVIQGNRNRVGSASGIRPAELKKLHAQFAKLRAEVEANAPADTKTEAIQKAVELQKAILQKKPSPSKMAAIQNWFIKNAPGIAGTVTSVIVHPIVGKLVEAAGDAVADEFRKKFG